MSQAAIGLANGVVILIRGDLSKDKTTKQKVIYEGEEPITGLGFREQTKSTILFIVTTSSIMSYNTTAVKPAIVSQNPYIVVFAIAYSLLNRQFWMNRVAVSVVPS